MKCCLAGVTAPLRVQQPGPWLARVADCNCNSGDRVDIVIPGFAGGRLSSASWPVFQEARSGLSGKDGSAMAMPERGVESGVVRRTKAPRKRNSHEWLESIARAAPQVELTNRRSKKPRSPRTVSPQSRRLSGFRRDLLDRRQSALEVIRSQRDRGGSEGAGQNRLPWWFPGRSKKSRFRASWIQPTLPLSLCNGRVLAKLA